jgi:tetratricopeptide (TPR) repeat protein
MTVVMGGIPRPAVYNFPHREPESDGIGSGDAPRPGGSRLSGAPPTGAYPGNLSLPTEVREKILSTFRHTLDLYRDGKVDDCLIGCDFILKMDPRFGPARKLQEKAKNPKAEVDVAELRGILDAAVAAASRRDTAEILLPSPEALAAAAPPPPPGATPAAERASAPAPAAGLDSLSLDSLSLDAPASDLAPPGSGVPLDSGFGGPFDNLEPTMSVEDEIALLLTQGDDARAAGDSQQAIEIWSRIFLIDINNADAADRIEETRREMSEANEHVAATLDQGMGMAAPFPGEEPAVLAPSRPAARSAPPALTPHDLSAVAPKGDVLEEEMDQSGPPGRRSWTAPSRARAETAPVAGAAEPPKKNAALRINPRIAGIAAVALVLVAAAGFFLLRRPAKTETPPADAQSGPSLERATALFRDGKIAETTAELRRIPPTSPDYANAQKLLASLGPQGDGGNSGAAPAAPAAPVSSSAGGPSDAPARRTEAERALNEKRYIDALKDFSAAEPAFRGDPTFAQEMAAASERVTELTPAVKLYNEGEYETAIPLLWRIYQAQRDNQDARSYLLRAYFNQGITQLQNGLYDKARESFGEAMALDPQDTEAARHRQFAERYKSGDLDLLGRIYVRYISPRP